MNTDFSVKWPAASSASISNATGCVPGAAASYGACTRTASRRAWVDCSSLPENLFESELFGHERGAFTGASTARGTLFLDEVGDIPLAMQVKLLRLLETGTYRRVGSTDQRHADIRVVSATHRDLDQMVSGGMFREDLYYRLSTFPIYLPSTTCSRRCARAGAHPLRCWPSPRRHRPTRTCCRQMAACE